VSALVFLRSIPTGLVFVVFLAAYGLLVAAVSLVGRSRRCRHAQVVSRPRRYGREFKPKHAKPAEEQEPTVGQAASSPEMGLAA
jgi:hypothetical protein